MAVGLSDTLPTLHPVAGIRLGTAAAGIRYTGRDDLVLVELAEHTRTAAVFTRNAFRAAPVIVAQRHLAQARPRYLLINAGNANAGTGERGLEDALATCSLVASQRHCDVNRVLPFSTGVISEPLPLGRFHGGIAQAAAPLDAAAWPAAARAIMTTDTVPKAVSRRFSIAGKTVTITGMAKGSGMICPNMATMLAYLATDAALGPEVIAHCLREAVAVSFNSITVDGDTSTNDACVLMATGQSSAPPIDAVDSEACRQFVAVLTELCQALALAIVRDGEGATKFITIAVSGGRSREECRRVAYTVAHSPLVKTAFFASDPNWGRILAAVGRAGIEDLDVSDVSLFLDDVCIAVGGALAPAYTEAQGQAAMAREEITIGIRLGRGDASATIWTCDLSHDYVRINAEYRT